MAQTVSKREVDVRGAFSRTLGIETSCDETAVAVLDDEARIEVNLLSSQVAEHSLYGGVVPELASREHLKTLPALVDHALAESPGRLELVAVTAGPGLVGALLVGVRFAAAFAWARDLPLVAVDHLQGHLASPFVSLDGNPARPMPARVLALVASGGHSSWFTIEDGTPVQLSRTRDDAAGESFDKVAQVLGLAYPGGPVLDRLARLGDCRAVPLPRPRLRDSAFDFSFSGLKSAAVRWIRDHNLQCTAEDDAGQAVVDLAASFEAAVVDQLLAPLEELAALHRPHVLTVSGGVAANTLLRRRLVEEGRKLGIEVLLPSAALTTDNAAMIAHAGQLAHQRGVVHDPQRLDAHGRCPWQPPGMRKLPSPKRV